MSLQRPRYVAPLTVAVSLLGLTACGDPPPAANVAPIEIVLDGCLVNRESVSAGPHEIAVVGSGEARVAGPEGAPAFQVRSGQRAPESFDLKQGTWTITCTPGGTTAEAQLIVTP